MNIQNGFLLFWSFLLAMSCSSIKQLALKRDIAEILKKSEVFSKHHTGLSIYDIDNHRYLSNYNADLLFTPASNIKLLTMYAVLLSFKDSIPALLYEKTRIALRVKPVAEPTLLAEEFQNQAVFNFLKRQEAIEVVFPEDIPPYGPGWAWDDYSYSFQTQRTWWPIYKNTLSIIKDDTTITVIPSFFKNFTEIRESNLFNNMLARNIKYNNFTAYISNDTSTFEGNIPFDSSKDLFVELLSDTLNVPVAISETDFTAQDTIYGQHVDTLLTKMMKPSDNFLAEQLFIQAAWKNGFESIGEYIDHLKITSLSSLDDMVWVDGSGLSRYNLIPPNNQVKLLKICLDEFGWERLISILPSGGEGTLEELYLSDTPFIYAKTGTLSNNHSLSGFLITKSGRRLIFSFMNNHFIGPINDVKKAMEELLIQIRASY
ncbi:MAG: D-alanyl-D-alanine carboxypeptidase [Bacteroidota bacterium]